MTLTPRRHSQIDHPAQLTIVSAWEVGVSVPGSPPLEATLRIDPPPIITVVAEEHAALPVFNPQSFGWTKGVRLRGLLAQETTTPYLLEPDSLVLRAGPDPQAPLFRRGEDYEADLVWGAMGRLANGCIKEGQAVYATYRHAQLRLDAVVQERNGRIGLRRGEPRAAAPLPPPVAPDERHLGNVWLPGRRE